MALEEVSGRATAAFQCRRNHVQMSRNQQASVAMQAKILVL